MNELLVSVSLTTMSCDCGGTYAISEVFRAEANVLGGFKKTWTCPYCGTTRGYGDGMKQKLEKQVAQLQSQVEYQTARKLDAQREAEHFRKSRDGMKGALVKTQVRVKNGVCPCCTRSFTNLSEHMKTKHPTYACEKV